MDSLFYAGDFQNEANNGDVGSSLLVDTRGFHIYIC